MNQTVENIKNRRSVNDYRPDQISDEELNEIIAAGMNAPSGNNRQTPIFIVIQNPEWIEKLREINADIADAPKGFNVFYGAPTVIAVGADATGGTPVQDASLAIGNMLNAAYSMGLGARWINRFKEIFETDLGKELLNESGFNGDYIGVGSCILGYPKSGFPDPI